MIGTITGNQAVHSLATANLPYWLKIVALVVISLYCVGSLVLTVWMGLIIYRDRAGKK